jgi:hypothetical protein
MARQTEMRNARLQNQDLARTSQFLNALLSKEDVKNADKHEPPEPPKAHLPNGNISFRSDGGKTRFSEPPAPPPSQPLPEKPDAARPSDAPSLKRATTERPKPASTSPIRQDNNNLNQILLLTEALNSAKKELDSHTERVRDLEEKLTREREARLLAEDMIQKMEESSHAATTNHNSSADAALVNGRHSELDKAFDPPAEQASHSQPELKQPPTNGLQQSEASVPPRPDSEKAETLAAAWQARIDAMALEMQGLREQLEAFRLRAERAEAERDADRKTLAEMVLQIRRRDEEEARREAERRARSAAAGADKSSRGRRGRASSSSSSKGAGGQDGRQSSREEGAAAATAGMNGKAGAGGAAHSSSIARGEKKEKVAEEDVDGEEEDAGEAAAPAPDSLSRATSMKPTGGALAVQGGMSPQQQQDVALIHTLPYASMIGVVLFGMGLMAYLNGWQPQPRLER